MKEPEGPEKYFLCSVLSVLAIAKKAHCEGHDTPFVLQDPLLESTVIAFKGSSYQGLSFYCLCRPLLFRSAGHQEFHLVCSNTYYCIYRRFVEIHALRSETPCSLVALAWGWREK